MRRQIWFVLFIFISGLFFAWPVPILAQENFLGAEGSNLAVKTGDLNIEKQDLDIKLHIGFAEIENTYIFKNKRTSSQTASFGFSYKVGERNKGLDNLQILVDNQPVELASNRESNGSDFIYWKTFETDFAPNQEKIITVSHWQLNGANLRGMRIFNYALKNKLPGPVQEFNLNMYLMDSLSIGSFNKTLNPDLDLKLEPVGWQNQGSTLSWRWQSISPTFDIQTNFYWQKGDLAKVDLSDIYGLYKVKTSSQQADASHLADSSFLTFWQNNAKIDPNPIIELDLGSTKKIDEIRIIPGKATSQENFLASSRPKEITLNFGQNLEKNFIVEDRLAVQTLKLDNTVSTDKVTFKINSVYAGTADNNLAISEIELGTSPDRINQDYTKFQTNPGWQQFFIDFWQKIIGFLKSLF